MLRNKKCCVGLAHGVLFWLEVAVRNVDGVVEATSGTVDGRSGKIDAAVLILALLFQRGRLLVAHRYQEKSMSTTKSSRMVWPTHLRVDLGAVLLDLGNVSRNKGERSYESHEEESELRCV